MKRIYWSPFLLACLVLVFMCNRTEAASLLYDFEQMESEIVLATLELTSLPATHNEVLGLTFTTEGMAIFGLPSPYPGTFTFTQSDRPFVDDGMNGLKSVGGGGLLVSSDPPANSIGGASVRLILGASRFTVGGTDTIIFEFQHPDFGTFPALAGGSWVGVPEPTTSALALAALLLAFRRLRTR